ncbi:hypothetical protein A9K55_008922 [Cordyceps militaris]|uniref:Cell wall galactomanno n=1 Tax=Cordyceps militaris TaxID=73501 RepID=A0A2H4SHB0_CORMI|nr:hypothetical protein A9K55_008922 [Cordyceps militaris]
MHLGSLVTAGSAALAAAAATPEQIVTGINSLTEKMAALQAPAQSITVVNAPLLLIGQGPFPQIIAGFQDIANSANALTAEIGTQGESKEGATVATSFRDFVRVSQATLNILIGKAGILQKVPVVGEPVASSLRSVEGAVDTLAITLINIFKSVSEDLENDSSSLGSTLDITIQKYESLQA